MPNFPQYSIIQQRENTDGKRNKKKVAPNKPKLMLLSGFFPFGLFFKQKVSKHTRLFSDGYKEYLNGSSTALSWLELMPRHL